MDFVTLVRRSRLPWCGHVLRRNEEVGLRAFEFVVEGVTRRVVHGWDGENKWGKTK